MKELEKGQDKIEKICEALRKETLEPAEAKAKEIIEAAGNQAESMIRQAEKQAEEIIKKARAEIEQEQQVFQSSLAQAAKQGIESLRQAIEHTLFNPELEKLIVRHTSDLNTVARIIEALIKAVEVEGVSRNLAAFIPQNISPQELNALLAENVLKKLETGSVMVGDFKGGAQLKILDKKMMVDMSDEVLKELLSTFIRKDFRKLVFNA